MQDAVGHVIIIVQIVMAGKAGRRSKLRTIQKRIVRKSEGKRKVVGYIMPFTQKTTRTFHIKISQFGY